MDMANDPGGFDLALYQAGQYGKADGSPAWMITVRQTEDEDRAGTRTARFCFDPVDESCWVGNPDLYAQTDIQVTNEGHLFYTRDWGENWSALPSRFEGQLAECIETCTAITRSSWYGFPPAGRPGGLLCWAEICRWWCTVWMAAPPGRSRIWAVTPTSRTGVRCAARRMAPCMRWWAATGAWAPVVGTGLFRCAPGAQSFEALALPAELDEHYPICGVAAGGSGEVIISAETSSENNWPALYYTGR